MHGELAAGRDGHRAREPEPALRRVAQPPAAERERVDRVDVLDPHPLAVGVEVVVAVGVPVDEHLDRLAVAGPEAAVRGVPEVARGPLGARLQDAVVAIPRVFAGVREPQRMAFGEQRAADVEPTAVAAYGDGAAKAAV